MWRWLVGLLFWLIYLRSPIDLLPDFIRPIGLLDDMLLLGGIWWYLKRGAGERSSDGASNEPRSEKGPPQSPHEVLGIAPGATEEEIEAAYKQLMKQYHPDRVHGLGEELQRLAREKSQAINAAYAALRAGH